MADSNTVLTALRNELVTAGLVRKPNDAGDLTPCHVEPEAAVGPGERDEPERDDLLVANLFYDGELARTVGEAGRPAIVIILRLRSRGTGGLKLGRTLYSAIKARLVDRPDYGLGWIMDAGGDTPTLILSSALYAGLGPIGITEDGTRDEAARFLFEVQAQ